MIEKTGWAKALEISRTIVEIIAIIVAGWWAYTRFWQEEAYLLLTRADIKGNLYWSDYSKDQCKAAYDVEFRNIGKTPIDVRQVRISAWSLNESIDSTQSTDVTLLDPLKMRSEPPLVDQDSDRLKHIYAPDERDQHAYDFIVKRSPGKKVLFQIDLWRKEDIDRSVKKPYWTHWLWSWVCGQGPDPAKADQSK
jgi:hypothetical protein